MKRACGAAFLALVLAVPSVATGEVVSRVQFSYFAISGNSPAEIYRSMLSQSKTVRGSKTLASISSTARQKGDLHMSGGSCIARNYRVTLDHHIRLPRLSGASFSATESRDWQALLAFIKQHETKHKHIWQSCALSLSRKVAAVREATCEKASARVRVLWKQMISSCDKQQRSFDSAQTKELMRLPFVVRATNGGSSRNQTAQGGQ